MAVGDITVFDEAKIALLDGTHDLDTHVIKCAVLDNTVAPTAADASPTLTSGGKLEVGGGSYIAGGITLAGITLPEVAGTVTVDSTTNPTWAANGSNDTDASWGLIYNDTSAGDQAIAFVELGTVDMQAGALTINWDDLGIFTLA